MVEADGRGSITFKPSQSFYHIHQTGQCKEEFYSNWFYCVVYNVNMHANQFSLSLISIFVLITVAIEMLQIYEWILF